MENTSEAMEASLMKRDHLRALREYQKSGKCPACGAEINHWNILRDRGWQYGIECDDCR
jgi:predicted RNA-binding Zn-ribbon protein involved in translation (DUF1610 family)